MSPLTKQEVEANAIAQVTAALGAQGISVVDGDGTPRVDLWARASTGTLVPIQVMGGQRNWFRDSHPVWRSPRSDPRVGMESQLSGSDADPRDALV